VPPAGPELNLDEAVSLLHVVRDPRGIDNTNYHLSREQVRLNQLQGGLDTTGVLRSISTLMLCNQEIATLERSARRLSKTDPFRQRPLGAAAAIGAIVSIEVDAEAAFSITPEEEEDLPGHVSIRFTTNACSLSDTHQRDLRDRLIRAFGAIAPVDELRAVRC
jgi:hypothetical protein